MLVLLHLSQWPVTIGEQERMVALQEGEFMQQKPKGVNKLKSTCIYFMSLVAIEGRKIHN